jgi:DNA-directed RNA polymerase specialized sigma24 family protein
LLLHDVLGHEVAEIASIAGAGISATQSRLLRARKELLRRARAVVSREGRRP